MMIRYDKNWDVKGYSQQFSMFYLRISWKILGLHPISGHVDGAYYD